jgi:hypothetical protein
LLVAAGASGLVACFVGYDSRWGETKRAQQRVAAQSTPASITATADDDRAGADAGPRATRTWRVRWRIDGQYLAQTVDAPKRITELAEDSNRILEPTLGLHLETDRIEPWSRSADEKLEGALAELRGSDPKPDADLVVGLIGALPRETDSLHALGVATMLGRHVILRAAARAGEHDAIDVAFGELSADDRARMVRLRRRHRALAVFLHEVGHCLGAVHEADSSSLMNVSYDTKMSGFGGGAVALMRVALDEEDLHRVARAQLALLEETANATWIPGDKEREVAALQSLVQARASRDARAVAAASAAAAPSPSEGAYMEGAAPSAAPEAPARLDAVARDRFIRAQKGLRGGNVTVAYEAAKPLFAAYPDELAVQDLRCQLAMLRWLPREQQTTECAAWTRLSGGTDGGAGDRCVGWQP